MPIYRSYTYHESKEAVAKERAKVTLRKSTPLEGSTGRVPIFQMKVNLAPKKVYPHFEVLRVVFYDIICLSVFLFVFFFLFTVSKFVCEFLS